MFQKNYLKIVFILLACIVLSSCMKKNLYDIEKQRPGKGNPSKDNEVNEPGYLYPFGKEATGIEAEITLTLESDATSLEDLAVVVPPLKYNKSLLFMLTQDDCKQSAFSMTWAAINGKPIDISDPKRKHYYDIENLEAGDFPPNAYSLGKTLGSTDGFGNEVRFHFTTTLSPEWDFMQAKTSVRPGFTENFYRFYMKAGLRWSNVRELLNSGNAIAFHDLKTLAVTEVDSLVKHFSIAQKITQEALEGRSVKFLAEPNGNKTYLTAALMNPDIQTMTAQNGAVKLIPYQVPSDLNRATLSRVFVNDVSEVKNIVLQESAIDPQNRAAIHLGVHETDHDWALFLLWLNDRNGKDGKDDLWFTSQEEYYEYNYNRQHSDFRITKDGKEVKIRIKFPNQKNFYYPALTLNIPGLKMNKIKSITSSSSVSGLSYGDFGNGISINVDCRKFLYDHADYYVKKYLSKKNQSNLADATYHVNALKKSVQKDELLRLLK